jgi:hypothetical protein
MGLSGQRVNGDDELFHGLASDQVFLDDFLEHFFIRRVIPDAVRIDNGDRARLAHLQAVSLRAVHAILACGEFELAEPFLKIVPSFQAFFTVAALRLSLIRTEKDVAP